MLALLPILSTVSNALRIPALAMFLGNLAAQVLGWFAVRLSKGLALNLTVLTMVVGLALAVTISINTIFLGLSYVVPPWISDGFDFFIPSNAVPCLSAIFSARLIRWVWEWQFYAINKVA
ncbi:hypothetical protein AKJ18_13935 [Vibrio xuii]|nr:hypothetical protein AKJ18_13935 [Vibrio xuii]